MENISQYSSVLQAIEALKEDPDHFLICDLFHTRDCETRFGVYVSTNKGYECIYEGWESSEKLLNNALRVLISTLKDLGLKVYKGGVGGGYFWRVDESGFAVFKDNNTILSVDTNQVLSFQGNHYPLSSESIFSVKNRQVLQLKDENCCVDMINVSITPSNDWIDLGSSWLDHLNFDLNQLLPKKTKKAAPDFGFKIGADLDSDLALFNKSGEVVLKLPKKWSIVGYKVVSFKLLTYGNSSGGRPGHLYYGFMNFEGKEITPPKFYTDSDENFSVGKFSDGMILVKDGPNGLYGFVNEDGILAIPCKFRKASAFKDGKASVVSRFLKRSFYIDRNGNRI